MFKKQFSDAQILDGLRRGGKMMDRILQQVYQRNKPPVFGYLLRNGAEEAEAKDIFQEAVIAFFENVQSEKFRGESAVSSYIFSIARFNWLNRLKRKKTEEKILAHEATVQIEKSHLLTMLDAEKENQVMKLFDELGERCQEILKDAIYFQYSMREIALRMSYKNEQIARNKKSKCLKALKAMIAERPSIIAFMKS